MKTIQIAISHGDGLHARPASLFCGLAAKFNSDIQVRNFTTETDFVPAKSILSILTLGVESGHQIELTADGTDEDEAIAQIQALIENNFPEPN